MTKAPIQAGDTWFIVAVNKRDDANLADFAKQHDDLVDQMLSEKRNTVFSDYLASTRQKMDAAGRIVIYKEALAKIDGPNSTLPGGEDDPNN